MKKILLVAAAVVLAGCRGDGLLSPDVLTYSAVSQVVPSFYTVPATPSVQTTVQITNNTDRTITFNYSRGDCGGFELRAYLNSDMSGTLSWSSNTYNPPAECDLVGHLPSPLNPGESAQLAISGKISSILGTDRPSGVYYFEVILNVGGADLRNFAVHIPAGSVLLAR